VIQRAGAVGSAGATLAGAMAHKVEVSPSGRASCRGCKKTIAKGAPRFGEEFVNQFSEEGGTSYRYWHLECAATQLANELAGALAAYEGPPLAIESREALDALIGEHTRPTMPYAERASTGRARCRACDENIAKGALRVAFERTLDTPMGPQKSAAYAHAKCARRYLEHERERGREAPEVEALLRDLEAHSKLGAEDLAAVRQDILAAG
jgi:ribosomal protein L37AE/L43A